MCDLLVSQQRQYFCDTITSLCTRINTYSARIDFRRQILTSKVNPRTVIVKIFKMAVDPYHMGIQMDRKELTKTFMMTSN